MNIKEACIKAKKEGRGIRRKTSNFDTYFIPTNTESCVLIVLPDKNKFAIKRWNPKFDDLIADDWEVVG